MVHQHRLDRLGKRFDAAARQAANHAVQVFVRRAGGRRGFRIAGRRRFRGHFEPMPHGGQHRILRIGRGGVGQFHGRQTEQIVPQTPLGQLEVVVNISNLNGRPLPLITFLQAAANHVNVGVLESNLSFGQIDHVNPVIVRDSPLDDFAVAQDDNTLSGLFLSLSGLFFRRRLGRKGLRQWNEGQNGCNKSNFHIFTHDRGPESRETAAAGQGRFRDPPPLHPKKLILYSRATIAILSASWYWAY